MPIHKLGAVLPPEAVGRDYLAGGGLFAVDRQGYGLHATLYGLAGISAGLRTGFEIHLFGLVAGIDPLRPALKVPGFGRVGL